jgi:hypothetical protein
MRWIQIGKQKINFKLIHQWFFVSIKILFGSFEFLKAGFRSWESL